MMQLRQSQDRGFADHGWLKSFHSFSFAGYYDPQHMGVGNLRVINEDRVAPGKGFGTHSHQDMEIISIVISGELAHKDSMGNVKTIPAGDVQRMSAGSGVTHSEFNHSQQAVTHFLQIWIVPDADKRGLAPSYEQYSIAPESLRGKLRLIAAPHSQAKGAQAVGLNADARLYQGLLTEGDSVSLALDPARLIYVHLIKGELLANGVALTTGDALTLQKESSLTLHQAKDAQVLVFDLVN